MILTKALKDSSYIQPYHIADFDETCRLQNQQNFDDVNRWNISNTASYEPLILKWVNGQFVSERTLIPVPD